MKRGLALGQRGHRENDGDIVPNMANGWETIQYTFVASNATMGAPIQNIPLRWTQSKGMAVLRTALALPARALPVLFRGRLRRWLRWCSRWWGS